MRVGPYLSSEVISSSQFVSKQYLALSQAVEAPMAVGKVKWFNDEKGWGFIKQDNGADVFVHYSQISGDGRRRLFEDETVEFEIKEGPKGLQAINVVRQEPVAQA
jgi:CspA family cold shock protein